MHYKCSNMLFEADSVFLVWLYVWKQLVLIKKLSTVDIGIDEVAIYYWCWYSHVQTIAGKKINHRQ